MSRWVLYEEVASNSSIIYSFLQQLTEQILPDFPHKGSAFSQFGKHGQYIAGRAARIRLKEWIAPITYLSAGKIYQ
jgi:hypothetical protein